VQDAVVLHIAAGADHDGPEVSPQHRPVPDTRAGGHGHVADQHRGRGEQNYSFDKMKAAGWHISLSLG
jgi:hypothetical protein